MFSVLIGSVSKGTGHVMKSRTKETNAIHSNISLNLEMVLGTWQHVP